jgi:hypothetical protein
MSCRAIGEWTSLANLVQLMCTAARYYLACMARFGEAPRLYLILWLCWSDAGR